jgi:hypothetical protein
MLSIKDKPQTKAAQNVTFEQPMQNEKICIEMLITLNTSNREVITGPDVDINSKILVTKEKPHFFFNPMYVELNNSKDDSIIEIQYQNYAGDSKTLVVEDRNRTLRTAIDYLNNGKQRKKRVKKNADKS